MEDIQQQLARLRQRLARIDAKYADGPPAAPAERRSIEQFVPGEIIRTPQGEHFETEKLWERHRRHGSIDISDLADLPADLLDSLSGGAIPDSPPGRWAFLDTETTGLAGGTGTCAFLVGVGSIEPAGFRLRQFFMRDYGDEPSMLVRLAEYLARFDVLVTYNGKAFDQPLLETRYRMCRRQGAPPDPFARMQHLDLLFGARRLWKLRLESCRLVELENRILGVEREGDIPGSMIPACYFEYLRTGEALQLASILEHNAIDILSLACLTAIVPFAFRSPSTATLRHGADWIGLARWMQQAGRREEALGLFRRAVDAGLPDHLLFRTLWDLAALEKRLGHGEAALAAMTELSTAPNPYRALALEELAKHYEHRERNHAMALEMTRAALDIADSPELRRRELRLQARLARQATRLAL